MKKTKEIQLKYPKLDIASLGILVYSDLSINNWEDGKYQLGFLIVLADKNDQWSIIHYSSKKSHRITRSSMAAETLAFVDAFDLALLINHDFKRVRRNHLPIIMLMDSEALFRILTRSRYITKRRLEIDICSSRESYHKRKCSNIACIHSEDNYAEDLTNVNGNGALLNLIRNIEWTIKLANG